MKNHLTKMINALSENNERIVDLLNNEKELLKLLLQKEELSKHMKDDFMDIYQFSEEMEEKRQHIDGLFKVSKDVQSANFGLLFGKKQQNIFLNIIKHLKDISAKNRIKIVCFSVDNLDIDREMVYGTVISGQEIQECSIKIPTFIYNVAFHSKSSSVKTMKRLRTLPNVRMINPRNMFNQSIVFDIISSMSKSQAFLLPFAPLSPSIIMDYMQKYDSIFLMPEKGLFNRKTISLRKENSGNISLYRINVGENKQVYQEDEVFSGLKKIIRDKKYMIIKGTQALKWNGLPLEARIYVQKGNNEKWDITGMVAKNETFSHGSIYNNMSDTLTDTILDIAPYQVDIIENNLTNYALNICTYLSHYIADLGSCSLDFIIDEKGNPYLIYFGGWEQRDFLHNIKDKNVWVSYLNNAFDYLLYLKNKSMKKGAINDMD